MAASARFAPRASRRSEARSHPLAACEHGAWASGHRGTGLDAVVRNVCNRLGGFEPDVRHRSDDGLVLTGAPAVLAVRQALRDTAREVAAGQRDLEVVS
jgi:hypothetical protein